MSEKKNPPPMPPRSDEEESDRGRKAMSARLNGSAPPLMHPFVGRCPRPKRPVFVPSGLPHPSRAITTY